MKFSYPSSPGPKVAPASEEPIEDMAEKVVDRSIGDLMRESRKLTDAQIEQILLYQREHDIRFGEAAVALNLSSNDNVV